MGTASIAATKDGTLLPESHNENQALAVGSAFKIFVLKALDDAVTSKRFAWEQVVFLKLEATSLPSGILQNWPAQTPLTIATLANLMISESDNTATDHLIHLLGRETVERAAPTRMAPCLTTSEVFVLKYGSDHSLRQRFLKGSVAERRSVLQTCRHFRG